VNWIVAILALASPLTAAGPADGPPMRMCVLVGGVMNSNGVAFRNPELTEVVRQLPAARVWFAKEFQLDVVELVGEDCPIRAELRYIKTDLPWRTVEIHFFLGDSRWGMKRVLAAQSPQETARNVIPYLEQFVWEVRLSTSPESTRMRELIQAAPGLRRSTARDRREPRRAEV
jgi:hypothetical protein